MRTFDVFYAFPSVLLAIALSGALGAGITNALVSLTIVFVPPIVRVAESVTTQVRNRDYVEAARATGAGGFTIVRVHVLGNVLSPIFVYATSLISVSMILASGLSRSEEHTSELQSLMRISYAVFCLKKKKKNPEDSR